MDIGFNPNDPSFVATAGSDGWVRYFDIRTREREGRSTKLTHARVPLTCISFHEEVSGDLLFGRGVGMPLFLSYEFSLCLPWNVDPLCLLTSIWLVCPIGFCIQTLHKFENPLPKREHGGTLRPHVYVLLGSLALFFRR